MRSYLDTSPEQYQEPWEGPRARKARLEAEKRCARKAVRLPDYDALWDAYLAERAER